MSVSSRTAHLVAQPVLCQISSGADYHPLLVSSVIRTTTPAIAAALDAATAWRGYDVVDINNNAGYMPHYLQARDGRLAERWTVSFVSNNPNSRLLNAQRALRSFSRKYFT